MENLVQLPRVGKSRPKDLAGAEKKEDEEPRMNTDETRIISLSSSVNIRVHPWLIRFFLSASGR